MMSLVKILFGNRDLMKFIERLEKIKKPEFKVSEFELDGKKWYGLLVRDKEGEKEDVAETVGSKQTDTN